MYRFTALFTAFLLVACAAVSQGPKPDPINIAVQEYVKAHSEGRFDEAAAKREEARQLLSQAPLKENQVLSVFGLYEYAGLSAQARAILESALDRLPAQSHQTRIQLLHALGQSWMQDHNLLKAAATFEKLATAMEVEPPNTAARQTMFGCCNGRGFCGANAQDVMSVYHQLATLYQQMGRPDAVAAAVKRMRASSPSSPVLAAYYESQGKIDDAAAIYKSQIEQAGGSPESRPFQTLAWLYQNAGRSTEAVAVLEQGIAALQTEGKPEAQYQLMSLRENVASLLNMSGQPAAAEKIYRQLLTETRDDQNNQGMEVGAYTAYATFLSQNKRGKEAETLLKNYLGSRGNLPPWQESSVLYGLANVADTASDHERAAEYRKAAEDKQKSTQAPGPVQVTISKELQDASAAANRSKVDEAFAMAMHAIDIAPNAQDRDQLGWQIHSVASALLSQKSPATAEQLYQRAFALLQSWSSDSVTGLLPLLQNYPQFLMFQRDRFGDVPAALERYRDALIAARGEETSQMEYVFRATIQFARMTPPYSKAIATATEWVTLEESLSGKTSEPYLNASLELADLTGVSGNVAGALQRRLELIPLADVVYPAHDYRRGQLRMTVARGLAEEGQREDAERLMTEAIAIGENLRPAQPNPFVAEAEYIRQSKKFKRDVE